MTTTWYSLPASRWDSSRTDRDALADPAQKFVRDRPRECGDTLDRQAGPPEYHRIPELCGSRQLRHVDANHVHRYPPCDLRGHTIDEHRGSRGHVARIAVAVAYCGDG